MKEKLFQIENLVRELLLALGEDPEREGLRLTPQRVAEMLAELTTGYRVDPKELIAGAIFPVEYDEMVLIKDIEYYSLCVHGRSSLVYTEEGCKKAGNVAIGEKLWTINEGGLIPTQVIQKFETKRRALIEIGTPQGEIQVTPEHPLMTTKGWVRACRLQEGDELLYLNPRTIPRRRYPINIGYELGYILGAVASDGSITGNPPRYVRLEVKDRAFAENFRRALEASFPGLRARLEIIMKPSGFAKKWIKMYRVRVTSSHVAQVLLGMFGGEKKTRTFKLPRIVRADQQIMQGFLDGYIDGDGYYYGSGGFIISSNLGFLEELGEIVGSHPVRWDDQGCYRLYISKRWYLQGWHGRRGFVPLDQPVNLEAGLIQSARVTHLKERVSTRKRYRVVNFECTPFNSYLTNGFLAHNCEHHVLPFFGKAHVGYIPDGKVIGFSKIPRIVDHFSHRLQLQERLTEEIANFLMEVLQPQGVGVVLEGFHLCMAMRGVKKQEARMVTSAMKGLFRRDPRTRAEFLELIGQGRG